eukprot:scaffold2538_cov235-Pinguiococcus_pyrenoidosus.AAC.11
MASCPAMNSVAVVLQCQRSLQALGRPSRVRRGPTRAPWDPSPLGSGPLRPDSPGADVVPPEHPGLPPQPQRRSRDRQTRRNSKEEGQHRNKDKRRDGEARCIQIISIALGTEQRRHLARPNRKEVRHSRSDSIGRIAGPENGIAAPREHRPQLLSMETAPQLKPAVHRFRSFRIPRPDRRLHVQTHAKAQAQRRVGGKAGNLAQQGSKRLHAPEFGLRLANAVATIAIVPGKVFTVPNELRQGGQSLGVDQDREIQRRSLDASAFHEPRLRSLKKNVRRPQPRNLLHLKGSKESCIDVQVLCHRANSWKKRASQAGPTQIAQGEDEHWQAGQEGCPQVQSGVHLHARSLVGMNGRAEGLGPHEQAHDHLAIRV